MKMFFSDRILSEYVNDAEHLSNLVKMFSSDLILSYPNMPMALNILPMSMTLNILPMSMALNILSRCQ